MQDWITVISNVGFPIACCIFLFLQNDKLQKTLSDISATMKVMSDRIKDLEK